MEIKKILKNIVKGIHELENTFIFQLVCQLLYLLIRLIITVTISLTLENNNIQIDRFTTLLMYWYMFYPITSYYLNKIYWEKIAR